MEYLEETRGEKALLPASPADRAVVRQLVHMGTHTRTLARASNVCSVDAGWNDGLGDVVRGW